MNLISGEMPEAPAMTPQFFGTEFEKIKSRNSLEKVVDDLGLTARWNTDKKTALKNLKDSIETKNIVYHGGRDTLANGVDEDAASIAKSQPKPDALERSIDTSDYVDAKRDFETDLKLLENMKMKLITEEIAGELPDESIVIHDEPAVTRRTLPSNPLAALKKAITPDTKSSQPLAREMALAEKPMDQKEIAAKSASPVQIPVPDIATVEPSTNFGDGDDFGSGFADKGNRSGDKPVSRNSIDSILNNPKPAAPAASVPIAEAQRLRQSVRYKEARNLLKQAEAAAPADGRKIPADERNADFSPPEQATAPGSKDQDARAELLAEVDKAWDRAIPAEGKERHGVDPFEDSDASGEIGSLTGLFSDGIATDSKLGADSNSRFNLDLRAGAEKNDEYFYSDFDGFANYGASNAGDPTGEKITNKFNEINQANGKELGFDWITKDHVTGFTGEVEPQSLLKGVAEGGFKKGLSEDVSKVEGEVPLLGDIPIAGRLFKPQPIDLADLSQEIPAAQEPFSTFSLNISDASFQLALAAVEKGERPDPESIKPEQFYNAVDYGDPAPSSLEPVAAAIDQTAHPVIPGRNLVRVAIRTASTGRSEAQPLRLTLLVDQSGSMARADRRAAMDTALAQLATLLTENDRITVIGFSRTPRLIADALPGNEAGKISDLINPTASEGGTNLEQALNLSSELALRHKLDGAQNRIVLFTDGAANLGDADPDRLAERVKELRQQGLAFDIAGIGTNDTNDRLLSELARHGNGRYYLVGEDTGASIAAQLAGAFSPAAENVKVQVKLNPERVGNYKLIGFEKDRLKTEDFHDDSVDAAELAADEAGVAIYQVETLPEGSGEIGEVSVRFRDTASGEMVERVWTIPHDPTTPAFDKADSKTQLATLALLAAQKLQGGPLADAIRFSEHAETIAKLKQTYANDPKAQQMLTLLDALK